MKKTLDIFVLKKENMKKIIVFAVSVLMIFFILISAMSTQKYNLQVNQIADVSIKAPYDIEDLVTTEKLRAEAEAGVNQSNVLNNNAASESIAEVNKLFSDIRNIKRDIELSQEEIDDIKKKITIPEKNEDGEDNAEYQKVLAERKEEELTKKKINVFRTTSSVRISEEDIDQLLKMNPKEEDALKGFIVQSFGKLYEVAFINEVKNEAGEISLKEEEVGKAQDVLKSYFNQSEFSTSMSDLGKSLSYKFIKANLVFDEEQLKKKKSAARESVPVQEIRKGEYIVQEGKSVNEAQITILDSLGMLSGNNNRSILAFISSLIIAIVIMGAQWIYLHRFESEIFYSDKMLILICVIDVIFVGLCRGIQIISPFIIPMALAPMLMALLLKNNVAITIGILNSILVILSSGGDITMACVVVINSMLGVTLLKRMEQRNDILYTSLYIGVINVVLVGGIQIATGTVEYITVLMNCMFVFLGAIFSGILCLGLLPFFESLFDIVTNVKLLELSNPNHPLLKRLLMEAPGTYNHSVLVGNLSEMGAQAVGANSVIARVGAFYHDIGKIKRPYFFKENQRGENPHDNITPNLSTLIITSHVKDGLELAKEHKLPMAIKDIIVQHHGSSLVKYFYITMKNNSENPDDVKEDDFRYPGPKPSSKEAAIVMLADSVEAAVRSLNNPTKDKIELMVSNIIKGKLEEGQLDECNLTMKDLDRIKNAFLNGLGGIYHQRIEYPKLVKKDSKMRLNEPEKSSGKEKSEIAEKSQKSLDDGKVKENRKRDRLRDDKKS